MLVAISQFQQFDPAGLESSLDFVAIGFRSIADLLAADPSNMYRNLRLWAADWTRASRTSVGAPWPKQFTGLLVALRK